MLKTREFYDYNRPGFVLGEGYYFSQVFLTRLANMYLLTGGPIKALFHCAINFGGQLRDVPETRFIVGHYKEGALGEYPPRLLDVVLVRLADHCTQEDMPLLLEQVYEATRKEET